MPISEEQKEAVRDKLVSLADKDPEKYIRVIHYLDKEEEKYTDLDQPPVFKTLVAALKSAKVFFLTAEKIAEDTYRAEVDPDFRAKLGAIYLKMLDSCDQEVPDDEQGFDLSLDHTMQRNVVEQSGFMGLACAWPQLSPSSQVRVLEVLRRFASPQAMTCVDEVVSVTNKAGGAVVMVGLAAVYIGVILFRNIRRWWRGEISGKRMAKNVVDAFVTTGAGIVGGLAGSAAGVALGPFGVLAGGVLGGVLSSTAASYLSDYVTQKIFSIPKEESLENAFNYLGVTVGSSNSAINAAYHRKCLETHPDKDGGSTEDFQITQLHMSVIKVAREDY